jgi:hypothetical protein
LADKIRAGIGHCALEVHRTCPHAGAIGHFGVKRAQRMLGLKIHTPETPATEALTEAARRYRLSAIRLTSAP